MVVINPVKDMFWGIAVDTGKRYSQVVDQTFHLSMAALEPGSGTGNEYIQVMLQRESSEFLLCSLQQGKIMQQPLDLLFSAGEELSFSLVGKGTVHLTGYIVEDAPEMEDDYSGDEYSEDDQSDAPELIEMDPELLKSGSKRKAIESALASKKKKMSESYDDDSEDDDDDDDDEDDESDDEDSDDEEFSEDELTFDEDEGSDFGDEEEELPKATKAVTPKGDASKKDKSLSKTPEHKKNDQKQKQTPKSAQKNKEAKTPQTPNTPANGESAQKKKNKKNKDGNSSMNQSAMSSPESTPKSAKKGKEGNTPKVATPGKKKVVAGGTVIEDIKAGHGPEAKPGKMVSVYYVGTLSSNNKRFDSCDKGKPFRFRLKGGEVIKGWDNGVEGMKVGGKRKIVVPPSQGYGNQRQGPIPPNSSLTFEVELKAVS